MLSVVMPNVIILSVVMLSVIMLSVVCSVLWTCDIGQVYLQVLLIISYLMHPSCRRYGLGAYDRTKEMLKNKKNN